MASSDELAGVACPTSASSSGAPLEKKERSLSTAGIGGREELRGLGEALVRLDFRAHGRYITYTFSWSTMVSCIVRAADRELNGFLHPYDDPALLESHGEQLLDFVIRLASDTQWKGWLENSMSNAAFTGATDVLYRLLASCEDSMDYGILSRVLMIAGEGGSVEILSALVAAGAGPLVREVDEVSWQFNSLHRAAKHGHRSFVAKLIEVGAPVDSRHVLWGAALTEAVEGGHKGVARELLAAGADVNKIPGFRFPCRVGCAYGHGELTPLCIAVHKNDEEMVKILLDAGADSAKGPAHYLPLHMAASLGYGVILRGLLWAGASVSLVDTVGRSALHLACAYNQPDSVDLLLCHNASVASLCNDGHSPMDVVGAQVLALRQRVSFSVRGIPGLVFSYPPTLTSAETSTVDIICDMLQSADVWGRRGLLVMMRSRPLVEIVKQADHSSDADNITLSVRAMRLVHEPASDTAGLREEGGTPRTTHDGGHATSGWSDAVMWLMQGSDENIFRSIVRFL